MYRGETARVLFRREIVSSADTLAGNHLEDVRDPHRHAGAVSSGGIPVDGDTDPLERLRGALQSPVQRSVRTGFSHTPGINGTARPAFLLGHGGLPKEPDALHKSSAC